jgi:hypothetical protein
MQQFFQNVKHQPTKMSISVSGRVAKCVTNADATAAANGRLCWHAFQLPNRHLHGAIAQLKAFAR